MGYASDIPICERARKKSFTFLFSSFPGATFQKVPIFHACLTRRFAFGVWRFVLVLVVVLPTSPTSGCGARLACEADFERLATWSMDFVGQAVLESAC